MKERGISPHGENSREWSFADGDLCEEKWKTLATPEGIRFRHKLEGTHQRRADFKIWRPRSHAGLGGDCKESEMQGECL